MDKFLDAPSFETFQDHVGSSFSVDGSDGDGPRLELAEVDTTNDVVDDWERFSLVFEGSDALGQGTYRLSGDGLDPFDVTLAPTLPSDPSTAPDFDPSTVEYEAVFNRHAPGRVASESGASLSADGLLTDGGAGLSAEPILAGISLFAGNFAPRGFILCQGQLMAIQQNTALYSILGTTYGGDDRQTFAVPDLRGRTPIGAGQGPGLTHRELGQRGGTESVTLTMNQLVPHTHGSALELPVSSSEGNRTTPVDNALAKQARGSNPVYTNEATDGSMSVGGQTEPTGGGNPHDNMAPYQVLNYVICIEGVYPSRP